MTSFLACRKVKLTLTLFFATVLSFMSLISCGSVRHAGLPAYSGTTESDECVRKSVTALIKHYPKLQLQDIYKFFFHDAFGPGHLIPSRERAEKYLRTELEELEREETAEDSVIRYFEPSGCGVNYLHVDLRLIRDGIVDFDIFFNAFYDGLGNGEEKPVAQWADEWNSILRVVESINLGLPDFDSDKERIDSVIAAGRYTMHHSAAFNRAYHPHYRLIRKDIFYERILPLIDRRGLSIAM